MSAESTGIFSSPLLENKKKTLLVDDSGVPATSLPLQSSTSDESRRRRRNGNLNNHSVHNTAITHSISEFEDFKMRELAQNGTPD